MASASSSVNGSGGSFCTLALVRCWAGLSFILPSRSARTNGYRITVAMLLRVFALQSKVASSPARVLYWIWSMLTVQAAANKHTALAGNQGAFLVGNVFGADMANSSM